MKKLIVFYFLFYATFNKVSAQAIKTYTGNFEEGTAVYQYYENENYERIFNGSFSYKIRDYIITGQFKNNLRNGLWKITAIRKNPHSYKSMINELVTATYINGNLDGLCQYKRTENLTKKVLIESSAFFKNNIPIGKYYYKVKDEINDFLINLHLDSEGLADSTYTVKYIHNGKQIEQIQKYKNGLQYFEINRNLNDGEIISKKDYKNFFEFYANNNDTNNINKLISYYEFKCQEDIPFNTYYVKRTKNKDLCFMENVSLKIARSEFSDDYSSYWDLANAVDFWAQGNMSNGGGEDNPLYFTSKGANKVEFNPVKVITFDESATNRLKKSGEAKKNKNNRSQLLDSLKWAVTGSLDFIQVIEPSKSYSISTTVLNPCLLKAYQSYNRFNVKNVDDRYFAETEVSEQNEAIRQVIQHLIKKESWDSGTGDRYNYKPKYYTIKEAEGIANWLNLKIASEDELNYAKQNKIIDPSKHEFSTFYFIR